MLHASTHAFIVTETSQSGRVQVVQLLLQVLLQGPLCLLQHSVQDIQGFAHINNPSNDKRARRHTNEVHSLRFSAGQHMRCVIPRPLT